MEDITCPTCLGALRHPVTLTCGHTFCRACLTTHRRPPRPEEYFCPKCCTRCWQYQPPTYRTKNLRREIRRGRNSDQVKVPPVPPYGGSPLQLVSTGSDGRLRLDESVVSECFMSPRLSRYPVCLLCVIGEKRRGKSFLLNYIIRALESQEKGEEFSLGAEDEPLQGFEWRSGTDGTTKGVWIWSRPFILGNKEDKVVVYLLDTEGSLDIEGNREICIKLSALSMLLSSHLIFNVAGFLKETELDYMEMYLHMGEVFTFHNLQYLDILVRDWNDVENCGREAALLYINQEIEKLQSSKSCSYPKVLRSLKNNCTLCFLLPHPGRGITGKGQGRLQDMDEDFKKSLRTYISGVVRRVGHSVKMDNTGKIMTCSHLPAVLKEIVDVLGQQKYEFSTPMEPSYLPPPIIRRRITEKLEGLTTKFRTSLLGPNPAHHDRLLEELESHLREEGEKFCSTCTTRFTLNAIGLGVAAGTGVYGVMGPAVAGGVVAAEVGTGTATMLMNGVSALVGRFLRGGL